MNILRIQCETCQSWLRVRDSGFVGEVHACPRCGGMVLIAAPLEASTDDPAALQEESAPTEAAAPVTLGLSNTLESIESADVPEPEAVTAASVAPIDEAPEIALPERSFGWAPIATTAVSLVSTVAILAVWYANGGPDATTDPIEVAANEAVRPLAVESVPALANEATTEADEVETTPTALPDESELAAIDPPSTMPPVASPVELPVESPAEPLALPTEPAVSPRALKPVALALHEEVTPPAEVLAMTTEIDPLAFDPNEVELVLRRGGGEAFRDPQTDSPAETVSKDIEPPRPARVDLDAQLAAAGRQAGVFIRRGPTDATTGPAVGSADKALAYVLPEVALRDIPLDKALRLIGNLAGTPITLDPHALRRSGVPASRPVNVVAEGESLAQILRTTLQPVRLDFETDGPNIRVVRAGVGKSRAITHRLADLAGEDPEALAELIQSFTRVEAPFELNEAGNAPLTADLATQYDLLVFSEQLRIARGLPLDTKYPRSLLSPEPSLAVLASKLERRTTFSFVEPTPLAKVFDHWRRVTDLSILVDWRSLADVGLSPQATIECSVTNRPWQTALDGILGPLGLTWSAVNGSTLFITTRDRPEPFVTNEFYPVDRSAAQPLIAKLKADHPNAVVTYDERSGRLLVRGDTNAHRAAWEAIRGQ